MVHLVNGDVVGSKIARLGVPAALFTAGCQAQEQALQELTTPPISPFGSSTTVTTRPCCCTCCHGWSGRG